MKIKGWKTILFNVVTLAMALVGDLEALPFITPKVLLYVNIIGNAILRGMTNSPIFNSIPGGGVDTGGSKNKSIPGAGVDTGG